MFLAHKSAAHSKRSDQIDVLLGFMIDILAKKVPHEKGHVKIDAIHHKVKLMPLPDDKYLENWEEQSKVAGETPISRNANVKHNSVVFIKVS